MTNGGHDPDRAGGVTWALADPYEYFMGRWSRRVAPAFLAWLAPSPGRRWLDVGCGSGALSEAILRKCQPKDVIAIDQSESFVNATQLRLGNLVRGRVGNALDLPVDDASADYVVSGLMLNHIPEPVRALAEMRRAVASGGTVALYVWDYSGTMELLTYFWEAATEVDAAAGTLQEACRFTGFNAGGLQELFDKAGFVGIGWAPIEIQTDFRDFDDYWKPFLGGQGPAPGYLMSLDESRRAEICSRLQNRLPIGPDGSIRLRARAWAIRGGSE